MARDEAYRKAEEKIEAARCSGATELDLSTKWDAPDDEKLTELPEALGQLTQLQTLDLGRNQLTALPDWLGQLTQLQTLALSSNQLTALPDWRGQLTQLQLLDLAGNQLTALPEWLGQFTQLQWLSFFDNELTALPEWLGQLTQLQWLHLSHNELTALPEWLGQLTQLQLLYLDKNQLTDLPPSLAELEHLEKLNLDENPLNPELAAAYKEGLESVKAYLRAKAGAQVVLNEAKLILVGEGEVGKSCLLGALRGDPWEEGRPTTHGIEIKSVQVIDPDSNTAITLNGWDFGGQRVYRPTHQLFFSAPAVYLVVWKPREGPQQGFVKEWIRLIKHREPEAKILVVATHGGPGQRQPDIDRQELRDLFGKETVIDFFHVESKPDETGARRGIAELKDAIARLAASLPEMGRSVPQKFQAAREALQKTKAAYLPLERVLAICRDLTMDDDTARLFVTISHRLGHLIHYQHDPALRDIVVLKPDWLATAISFVLDDEVTRRAHGLVSFARLRALWDDPNRAAEFRYPSDLPPIFLRLMERFDLSYRVAGVPLKSPADETSLIAQLVPDNRPEQDLTSAWPPVVASGDTQQVQICRIVDEKGQSAQAEGLFYQLIVRLHKYSLGRADFRESVHWQRGVVLDDDYNGRALVEHVGNDVQITVRAPYPERFLSMLTAEVKYLVESFWEGLRCDVMVPCIEPCGKRAPGTGLFEVQKLVAFKRQGLTMFPCMVSGCDQMQAIDRLLRNAPAARPLSIAEMPDSLLLVTVTKVEAQAVLQVFTQQTGDWPRLPLGKKTYYDLGMHGDIRVLMVQSEMGSATPGGALLTVRQAIQDMRPQAVIMCGIAFGLRKKTQRIGDILVARQLQSYEPQKVDRTRGTLARGARVPAADRLLDRFRSGDNDWRGATTHFGLVMSGEKVINDLTFCKLLLENEPEAIGGEMEGAGLYAAARDASVDWILVKAICDWADGKKQDQSQAIAAQNAAQFVHHVISLGGWGAPDALALRAQLTRLPKAGLRRFDGLNLSTQRLLSKVDAAFTGLLQALTDEAKEGPRLFSLTPVANGKFRLTLWCEHARLPLPALNPKGDQRGVYDLTLPHEWIIEAAPYLKTLTETLSLVLPVASSSANLTIDDATYKRIADDLERGKAALDAVLQGGDQIGEQLTHKAERGVEPGAEIRAQGAVLRPLHGWLKEKDPGFGGLVRVLNKRQEFLWVHEQFEKEY